MEKSDFCSQIEKRVRKHLRLNELFKKDDKIYVKDKLSLLLINRIVNDLPKSFTKDPKKANKIVIKYTLDDECNDFLEKMMCQKSLIRKKQHESNIENQNSAIFEHTEIPIKEYLKNIGISLYDKKNKTAKGISVLSVITDKEALLFARYNGIDFKPNKKNKKIKEILDKLEQLYPQTRYSLSKSISSLK
jgi:hypothetical protein